MKSRKIQVMSKYFLLIHSAEVALELNAETSLRSFKQKKYTNPKEGL